MLQKRRLKCEKYGKYLKTLDKKCQKLYDNIVIG
jgi:hypothetical protein